MQIRYEKMCAGCYKVYANNVYIGHMSTFKDDVLGSMWTFVNTAYDGFNALSIDGCKREIENPITSWYAYQLAINKKGN